MSGLRLKCPDCTWGRYDTLEQLRAHRRKKHEADDRARADGGLQLDGRLKYRVVWSMAGYECKSEPLPEETARELADVVADETVTIEYGERPLADDETAVIEPVEVEE